MLFRSQFSEVRTGFLYDYIAFVQKQCESYIKGTKVQDILDELDGARKMRLKEKVCDLYNSRIFENKKILESIHSYSSNLADKDSSLLNSLKEYKYRLGKDANNTDLDRAGRKFKYASFSKIAKGYSKMVSDMNEKFCDIIDSLFMWAGKQEQPQQLGAVTIAVQAYNIFADVTNFAAAAILTIFTVYSRNLRSVTEFFKSYDWNTTGTPTPEQIGLESAEEEEFLFRGHTASLIGIADNFITKIKNVGYSNELLQDMTEDEAMTDLYKDIISKLSELKRRLQKSIKSFCSGDTSVEEVKKETGLSDDDIESLLSVEPILDMSGFNSSSYISEVIISDLLGFKKNIQEIADNFDSLREGIAFISSRFNMRTNMEHLGEFYHSEVCEFLKELDRKIIQAQKAFGKAFGVRLRKLTEGMRSRENTNDFGIDFEGDSYQSCRFDFNDEETTESANYEDILSAILTRKIQAFHEADDNTNQDNKNSSGDNPPKPQVQDGSNNQNNGDNNQNQNQNNDKKSDKNQSNENKPTTSNEKKGKMDIAQTARNLLDKLIENITAFMEKGSKKKNLKFISENKEYLLSRNYSNTSVNLLPYRGNTDYAGTLKKIFDAAKSLDDNSLKTMSEEQIINRILASINIDKVKGDNLEARIVQAMKTGSKPMNNVTVANGDLGKQVPKMIRFCEHYYNSIISDLQNAKKDLDVLDMFKNKSGNGDNDRTSENIAVVKRCITGAIRGMQIGRAHV